MENKPITENRQQKNLSYNRIESVMGMTGKVTPQAIEFEEAVLGALMMDSETVSDVLGILTDKMFYVEANQHIFEAIQKLFIAEQPIDLLTVTNQLRKDKVLESVGGASYLASLTNRVSSSANIQYHARVVMEKYVVRELIKNCNSIITDAYDESLDVLELLDKSESKIFNIIEQNFHRDSKPLHQVVMKAINELSELRSNSDEIQGVPSGIRAIDAKTGGWQPSDLIILAARPGMGKTSFVLSVARNAAIDNNRPVAFFSLEMSATQLVHRLFSIESGINAEKIAKGTLSDEEWIKLMDSVGKLESSNLIIDDTPALSIFDLRAKCRRLKHQHNIQMIIIDYLQLMTGTNENNKTGNREQEISHISRSLKALAKDLNVPVIALSQLSRAVENRANSKRPQLSDLRESGSIEQDADMVLFIYRPEYYKLDTFEDDTPSAGLAEINFEKNRHGSPGPVRVRFQAQYTKFSDIEDGYFTGSEDTFSATTNPVAAAQALSAMAGIQPNKSFEEFDSKMNDDSNDTTNGGLPADNPNDFPF
ncbi:MAG: replicative DNA helicase [Bacteroidales bacterium]|nr:replicative DNA helicase [Bacteroidales bacterium]